MEPVGKVILITGCSTGFGRLMSHDLAKKGHAVYASMRNLNTSNSNACRELNELSKKESLNLKGIELDVTDTVSIESAVQHIISDSGRIDVLINNAGTMNTGISEGFSLESIQRQFDTNVFGPARTIKAVLPHMRKQKSGLLIQISSLAGRYVFPFFGIYCASKFAVEALAESYKYELDGFNIDSIIIEPGNYASNLTKNAPMPDNKAVLNEYDTLAYAGEQQLRMLEQLNNQDGAPQPQEVIEAISQLIDMEKGERPLRTVVKGRLDVKTDELNERIAIYQNNMLKALGYVQ